MRLEDLMERAAQYDENLARDIKLLLKVQQFITFILMMLVPSMTNLKLLGTRFSMQNQRKLS